MREHPLRLGRCLLAIGLLLLGGLAHAAGLDLTSGPRLDATAATQWCVSNQDFADLLRLGCDWQPLRTTDLDRGLDSRVYWLRLQLDNPGAEPLTRWIQVGQAPLEQRTLYQRARFGWRSEACGWGVPRDDRPSLSCKQSLLSVDVPAHASIPVWIRIASRTTIDLGTIVWEPQAQYMTMQPRRFITSLAFGTLLLAGVLSLLIALTMGERMFAFFGLAMLGELLAQITLGGYVQRLLWPSNSTMPVQLIALATLLTSAGLIGFFDHYSPRLLQLKRDHRLLRAPDVALLLGLIWAVAVDYGTGARVASVLLGIDITVNMGLLAAAWRSGERHSLHLLLSLMPLAFVQFLHEACAWGWHWVRPDLNWDTLIITMQTPVLLTVIAHRSRHRFAMLQQLQLENRARVEFLAKMSHELRSPIDTILGNAQWLAREHEPNLLQRGLRDIEHSGRHLLAMLDEILEHARGLAGQLRSRPEPVHWTHFVATLERQGELLARTNDNRFSLHCSGPQPDWLDLDPRRLRQVLDNLLRNAARHTRHGLIRLELDLRHGPAPGGLLLTVAVTDSGDGIAEADLKLIFLPFRRATNGDIHGLGLGLTIAQQLVELMGGTLQVSSKPGQGARFSFTLPTRIGHAQPHVPAEPTPAPAPQHPDVVSASAPALRQQLRELLEAGRISDILAMSDDTSRLHPEFADWAAQVRVAARLVDFHALAQLCEA